MPGAAVDPFAGVCAEVPPALAAHLRSVALVDHHVHGVFDRPTDRATFEAAITEAATDPVPGFMTSFDSPLGLAIRRWCAPLIGLPAHACADEYWRRRSESSPSELAAVMLRAANVDRWIVDTGYRGELVTTAAGLAELSGRPAREILRLERLAEDLLGAGVAAADYPGAFRAAVGRAAASGVTVGAKSIAAYRVGFDIDWRRPGDDAVAGRVGAVRAGPAPHRLADPVLIAFGVHEAAAAGLPIQLHVGFGDREMDLHRSDPMLLLPLLRAMPAVPVVLLHCYPFHRQAGYLAQAFGHVNFDVGLAVNYLGAQSTRLVGEALETAPFAKQLYSSDGFGPPELHLLGSVLWRRAMGLVLGGWVRRGDCSEHDAIAVVDMIGVHNARRVYGG